MAVQIVGIQWFLDPRQLQLLQRAPHAQRGGAVPLLVDVDHQRHIRPQRLAQRPHAAQVLAPVRLADLELDATDAARQRSLRALDDLLDGRLQIATGGVVAGHRIALGSGSLASGNPARRALRSHSAVSKAAMLCSARPQRPIEALAQPSRPHRRAMSLGSSPSSSGASSRA